MYRVRIIILLHKPSKNTQNPPPMAEKIKKIDKYFARAGGQEKQKHPTKEINNKNSIL